MPAPSTWKLKRNVVIKGYKGGGSLAYPDFELPAGLKLKPITSGLNQKGFYLDELPKNIFPVGSGIRHDATHYGVHISLEDAEEVPGAMDPDWWTSKKLTPEAIAEARKDVWVPYATARKNEKLLTIEMGLGKSVRVVHAGVGVLYKGTDAAKAIEIFTNTYHDRVTGIIPEKD